MRDRFDDFTVPEPNTGCLLWLAGIASNGYGVLRHQGHSYLAHRFAYERQHGPIPAGLCVCHVCDTRLCVNPAHMFLGTHADNVRDKVKKGRTVNPMTDANKAKTHCLRGHPFSGENLFIVAATSRRPSAARVCRACYRARKAQYRLLKKAELARTAA